MDEASGVVLVVGRASTTWMVAELDIVVVRVVKREREKEEEWATLLRIHWGGYV